MKIRGVNGVGGLMASECIAGCFGEAGRSEFDRGDPADGPPVSFEYDAGITYPLSPPAPVQRGWPHFAYGKGLTYPPGGTADVSQYQLGDVLPAPTTCKCDGTDGDPACAAFCMDDEPSSSSSMVPLFIGGVFFGGLLLWIWGVE